MIKGIKIGLLVALVVVLTLTVIVCAKPAPTTTAPTTTGPTTTTPKPTTPVPTTPKPTTVAPTTTAPTPTAPAESFKWKFHIHLAAVGEGWDMNVEYVNKLKEMSGGRLDVTLYPGGALVPSTQILQAIQEGLLDMGWVISSYYTGVFPEASVMGSQFPGTLRSWDDIASLIYTYKINDVHRKIYEGLSTPVKGLSIHIAGGMYLWSKKPLVTLADMKTAKIRTFGLYADMFKALGATPAFVPHEEGYMALQLGTIDAYNTAFYIFQDYKHYETTPYIMTPAIQLLLFPGDIVANMDAFNKLPDDLKAILLQLTEQRAWRAAYLEAGELDFFRRIAEVRKLGYKAELVPMAPETVQAITDAGVALLDQKAALDPKNKAYADLIKDLMRKKGYIQ